MEYKFSLSLFIGFILAGVLYMIGDSQWVGIAILILSAVWGFLFINPKSPLRKYWWSVSGRLGVLPISKMGINEKYLTIYVGLRAVSVMQVEKIRLKIGRRRILSDWKPTRVEADETRYVNFVRPDWLHAGEYKVRLIAYTPDGFSKSEKFSINVDN